MTTLNDLNGYLDDEAYTIRVGELRALLSASIADTAGANERDALKQKGLDDHLRRLEQEGMKSEEDDRPHGWKGSPDLAATPAPSVADAAGASERIKALFIENPTDEMGPSDEPESQYRLGYNTALEDAIDAIAKESGK